ncbi:MAG: flagellar biosynthesis protein FlhB [Treponema sp.]|nr:flagellar biosynthesis protein FlhB [Treponema sp.]
MSYRNMDLQWFAAEDEGRTEEPSELKLQKARREGRVAKSQELSSAVVFLLTVAALLIMGPRLLRQSIVIVRFYYMRIAHADVTDPVLAAAFFNFFIKAVLPVALVGAFGAIVGNIIQTRGFLFSTKPIQPQFTKILPHFGEYFKRTLFSFQGLFNVAKSLLKVILVAVIAYLLIKGDMPELLLMLQTHNIYGCIGRIAAMGIKMLVMTAVLFFIIAVPDYFVQRREFMESMKMTKQETKEEYKEMEGDPEVKSHLQQAQRALLERNMPKAVAESDVVITNPTHFAVALKYDAAVTQQAPQVMAKGADEVAFRIKAIARENDVPIVENRPLARGLYTSTNVGDIIPPEYIRAIVTVYTQIDYALKK